MEATQFGLLLGVQCFEFLQLAGLSAKHGGFDFRFFQRFVAGGFGRGASRGCALCSSQRLLGGRELRLEVAQFRLLLGIQRFEFLQLADLSAEHGGFDLGFFGGIIGGWHGCGWCCWRGGSNGIVQCLLRDGGCLAQFGDLGFELWCGMNGELFLGLLHGNLGHAGFDLELLLLVGEPGFVRLDTGNRIVLGGCRAGFVLNGLGPGGALGTGFAVSFLLFLGAPQAVLAQFEALLGMFGLLLFLFQCANFAFGGAVVLHERDARWANVGTGTALDAVEQVVCLELFVFLTQREKMQLLRQQAGRAGLGTFATANARQCRRWRRQFLQGAGEQAVGGLDQRDIHRRQREAHHRPAHDESVEPARLEACEGQQLGYRCADERFDVHRPCQRIARQGGDP